MNCGKCNIELVLVSSETNVKTYECPVCHRVITESIGEPQEYLMGV